MHTSIAQPQDATAICNLLNLAYRGAQGWTNESHLIGGIRTTADDVKQQIESGESIFILHKMANNLHGCIAVECHDGVAHIGSFAVAPNCQNMGMGKKLLDVAEAHGVKQGAHRFKMQVLSTRTELLDFYYRRGYQATGEEVDFPYGLNVGEPKVMDLKFLVLNKLV